MQPGSSRYTSTARDTGFRYATDSEPLGHYPALRRTALSFFGILLVILILGRTEPRQDTGHQREPAFPSTLPHPRGTSLETNYLHAVGAHLEDVHGLPFTIRAINWSGLETPQQSLGGLNTEDYRSILAKIKTDGLIVIRIPLSNQMVEAPIIPITRSAFVGDRQINEELAGLTSLQILDLVVGRAASLGLRVILDNHRSEAGSSAEPNGLWFTERFTEAAWIEDWLTLTQRYENSPNVVGMDLRNEPHNALAGGACWGCDGPHDWRLAAERAGDAVLSINPKLLIIVEGTDSAQGQTTWWGGNLAGVRLAPVRLSHPSQLVYSAHVYGPTEFRQPWFTKETTPAQLWTLWDKQWGFVST